MKNEISEYDQQAIDFLKKTGAEIKVEFIKNGKHFDSDKENRDIYSVTLSKGGRSYTFNFGQSIAHSGRYMVGYKMAGNHIHRDAKPFNDHKEAKRALFFGQGMRIIPNPKFEEPSAYSVLACLQKYDVGSLEDFCGEFGYDTDSKEADKIYEAVKDEYMNVSRLFSEAELEEMREIQ